MFWKRYRTPLLLLSAILAGCSTPPITQINPATFGAVTANRQFVPHTHPLVKVPQVVRRGNIVNARDYLAQVENVQAYAGGLAARNAATYQKIAQWLSSGGNPQELGRFGVNIRLMRGEDGYHNVLMTGYYSPVIQARRTPQGTFRHPIYAMPAQKRFTRQQIYAGALAGKGLELAYSNSMLDNFLLGVQGSGYVDFGDGRLNYFAYAGQNGFKYVSIGRLLVEDGEIPKEKMSIQAIREWGNRNPQSVQGLLERNPSYVFFKHDPTGQVKGSAGVPLIALASVASDRSLVPSGSVLLVEMPLIDKQGNWTGKHELRLMVALDVGGAVKGQHFDLYQGIGDQAGHQAGLMKHYGRVWVLQ